VKKKTKWIIISVVILAMATGSYFYFRKGKTLTVTYRPVKTTRGDLEITILSTGSVQPENRVEIKPPVAGRVETVIALEGQYVKKGQVLAWMSSTERAALIDAAQSKGPEELKKWEELYRATPILAPISGTIILRSVESGQTFTGTDSVYSMSDRLTVKAQVDETDIAQIKLKQSAKIILDAYANDVVPARVDLIAFDAKTVNSVTTYDVDVLPIKTPAFMRSGMTANVVFLIDSKKDVVLVPNEALRVQDNKYSLLVRVPNQELPVEKPIEVGLSDGKKTEVLSGVDAGETVLAAEIKMMSKAEPGKNPFSPFPPKRTGGGGSPGGH
jgi:macrolide-specific efflux system membrane fusion protein